MATGINSVVANLELEFEAAKRDLDDVDHSIRRLTGREPGAAKSRVQPHQGVRRTASQIDPPDNGHHGHGDEAKRRRFIAFSRINRPEADDDEDEERRRPTLASSVVANPRPVKPRTQALEEQKGDKKSMARNRRMFGMIVGTLQRFQSEESRRKVTTQKREEIEKKLDQVAEEEKNAIVKERKELFKSRRQKQAEMRKVELKMERVEIHQEWERSYKYLGGFIRTKTKPFIFYMPKKHNSETEKRLEDTKDKYKLIVAEKRAKVQKELAEIDECYKKEVEDNEFDDENEPSSAFEAAASNERVSTTTDNASTNVIPSDGQLVEDKDAVQADAEANSVTNSDTTAAPDGVTVKLEQPTAEADEEQSQRQQGAAEPLTVKDEFEPIYDE